MSKNDGVNRLLTVSLGIMIFLTILISVVITGIIQAGNSSYIKKR
jgi:hypothetical protein